MSNEFDPTVSLAALRQGIGATAAPAFLQTNLISDGSVSAPKIDPHLINPWGISAGPNTPFWISDQATGFASVDAVNGTNVTLNAIPAVTVPSPTGQVFNSFSNAFVLPNGSPATFLFASTTGSISGWNAAMGTASAVGVTTPNAAYTGLAIGMSSGGPALYAANAKAGTVDLFDGSFKPIKSFTDPTIPAGFSPYNVQVLDNKLYVTYSRADRSVGPGQGFVDSFDLDGKMIARVGSAGTLDDPWGLAIAPASFGSFAGDLLVGNFGDGTINVFDKADNKFIGQLAGTDGKPIAIEDLWALTPGNGGAGGDPNAIYFSAGLAKETHGLFGSLTLVPTTT